MVSFIVIAIPMTMGLWGMAISLVIVNLLKILMIMLVGNLKI